MLMSINTDRFDRPVGFIFPQSAFPWESCCTCRSALVPVGSVFSTQYVICREVQSSKVGFTTICPPWTSISDRLFVCGFGEVCCCRVFSEMLPFTDHAFYAKSASSIVRQYGKWPIRNEHNLHVSSFGQSCKGLILYFFLHIFWRHSGMQEIGRVMIQSISQLFKL